MSGTAAGGAFTMLLVLNRCRQPFAADQSALAQLPYDILGVIQTWVVYAHLGFVGCCRSGCLHELKYALDCPALAPPPSADQVNEGLCWSGSVHITRFLTERFNLDVSVVHFRGRTPAMEASLAGRLDVLQFLVARGADITAEDDYALQLACSRGHVSVAKFLIECGADVSANDDYALRWAAREGQVESVRFLLEHGADVNASNDYALQLASMSGRLAVVRFLVENGANIKAKSCYALRVASSNGHTAVAQYLSRMLEELEG